MTNADEQTEPRIRSLADETVQRIAAGEVVERPASVVKELLENSLDAGASRITVDVHNGGTAGIRVSDNGHGIPRDQLPRALEEHATSKIRDIADLDGGVASLGFRGEALSTIAAVSRLTIRSRPQGGSTGAELTAEGGDYGEIQPAGCPEGTTVEVDELFFNTPARKKFLKRESTEFDHINTVVSQYALANPDVAISLSHNDRQLFGTEGGGSLRSAVLAVYGREVAESMIELTYPVADETALDGISGLISHPETTRSTREYLATFVNDRYVTDSALRGAVVDGYGGQLAPDRYPFAVLFVDVPPESVDVNVHPRKTEVRFNNDDAVLGTLAEAVERTLVDDGLIRAGAPRGRSAPAETPVAPDEATEHEPVETRSTSATTEILDADSTANQTDTSPQPTSQPQDADQPAGQTIAEPLDPADEASWTVAGLGGERAETPANSPTSESTTGLGSEPTTQPATRSDADQSTGPAGTDSLPPTDGETDEPPASTPESASNEPVDEPTTIEMGDAKPIDSVLTEDGRFATGPTIQQTLSGDETTDQRQYDRLPPLRVLGQLHETYLLAATDDGLVLVDQHAADERVNYERLQRAFETSTTSQRLADPVMLELTAREAALFADHGEALNEIGFVAEQRGERAVEVQAVPAVFSTTLEPSLLREALLRFVESTDGGAETVDEAVDELLADLACYPSVTGNTSLTEGSVVDLLSALDSCENPYACPHGRPVIIEISREEIEDRFERDYPGHSGRRAE